MVPVAWVARGLEMREVWRDIPGFEGRYLISNLGRVWSNVTGKELRQQYHNHGYMSVALTLRDGSGKKKMFLVHRLVAESFLPNADGLPTVNHKDGDKRNNQKSNLEWMSYAENHKHAYKALGRKAHTATLRDTSRACECLLDGIVIASFPSATDAANSLGLRNRSVSRACLGQRKTCGGFQWRYK